VISPRDRARTSNRTRIIVACVLGLLAAAVIAPAFMIGSGSESDASAWAERFRTIDTLEQARATYPSVEARTFEHGEWIIWVSTNSHGNPWGGTVVTKDSRGRVRAFYCGWGTGLGTEFTYSLFEPS
jgi:hypothetical protein